MRKPEAGIQAHGHVAYHSYIKQPAEQISPFTLHFFLYTSFNSIAVCIELHFFPFSFSQEHFPWSFIYYQESSLEQRCITNMPQLIHFLNNIFPWNDKRISSSSWVKYKSTTIWCWYNLYVCTLPVCYLFKQWLILLLSNNQPVKISRTQVLFTFTMLLFTIQITPLKYQIVPERIHK